MTEHLGLLLAGGTGTRLYPTTASLNKHLLPVYDKPMIYYPLTNLMLAGCKKIALVSSKQDMVQFAKLLGDGTKFGISLEYFEQRAPEGIADAISAATELLVDGTLIVQLADNFFYGSGLPGMFTQDLRASISAEVFLTRVSEPERYGVLEVVDDKAISIIEKPENPKSDLAITGLYKFRATKLREVLKDVSFSDRGEKEVTSILQQFMNSGELEWGKLPRGSSWMDMGTPNDLKAVSTFVQTIQSRQGILIGSPEEAALSNKWLSRQEALALLQNMPHGHYRSSLESLLDIEQ